MPTCKKCGLEIEADEVKCMDCGSSLHRKCSKQYSGKRYCKKCGKKVRDLLRMQTSYRY